MSKPNPMPVPRTTTNLNRIHRKVLCSHYESCLDNAIGAKWKGFSCESCDAYSLTEWSETRWLEDAYKCAALTLVVDHPEFYDQLTC